MSLHPSRLDEPDYQSLAHFRHLVRRFVAFSEEVARGAGLKPQQHQLLLSIKGLPSDGLPTIGALAWQLQLKHHTVVGLVDRLSALGLVRRNRNVLDHREVLIEVTPKGDALLRRLSVAHRSELRRMAPLLLPALTAIFQSESEKELPPCPTPTLPQAPSATSRRRRGSSRSPSLRSRSAL
ncbi:MAG TPA: MarR family transcriptional regulator [Planctomycetota bacterium]|nr:MarR family transcriptional regulator [Planctomycetota bacterium]